MVGNAWNARKKPRDVSPCAFTVPGARANLPKTNSVPARAHFRTLNMIEFKNRKKEDPTGLKKTKQAKAN